MYDDNGNFYRAQYKDIQICCACRKLYTRVRVEQVIGTKERDYDVCPYCHVINHQSWDWNFYNEPFNQGGTNEK